jgi:ERF superfamily
MSQPEQPDPLANDGADTPRPPVPDEGSNSPPAPLSGTPDPILAMIERAARDPAVDLAKLQGLMAMKERVEAQRASIAFAEAFTELQPELPTIDRNGQIIIYAKADRDPTSGAIREGATPIQRTRYATLDDILEALRAPLGKHGFSLRFEHQNTDDNRLVTTAILRHRTGHEERATTPPLKHDTSGSKNDVQAVGSGLSYGRRYALMAVLPIVSHAPQDADDDGMKAGSVTIDADQLAYISQQLRDTSSDIAKFLDTVGAPSLEALTVKQYQAGLAQIQAKKRQAAERAKQQKAAQ